MSLSAPSASPAPSRSLGPWLLAGVLAGLAGLATSYLAAEALTIRAWPLVAVSEGVVRLTPGPVVKAAIELFGAADKAVLQGSVLAVLLVVFALVGWWARRSWWKAVLVCVVTSAIGLLAVLTQRGAGPMETVPIWVGLATWLGCLRVLASALTRDAAARDSVDPAGDPEGGAPGRRSFLLAAGGVTLFGVAAGSIGRVIGQQTRAVQESISLLRIPGVTNRSAPAKARIGLPGVTAWRTANEDFYRIDTTLSPPAIEASAWRLRVHGLVERELELSYDQLLARGLTESWVTLNCVSNPVGGPLIGNAWWSGVLTRDLLKEAGPLPGADAVLQTSADGWTCSTPLVALTDARDSLLAVAMNGDPLPIEHGFPARTIVPGLYGYVSACKWVVDLEVTRFADVSAYWTERGWSELGPVKLSSRIDVPASGATVPAGNLRVGGMAWHQSIGISTVEVALDGGAWVAAEVASPGTNDTWVQWATTVSVAPGEHVLLVRAIDKAGQVQTGVRREVLPNGATGWHQVDFTAEVV